MIKKFPGIRILFLLVFIFSSFRVSAFLEDAKWVGPSSEDLSIYSYYLPVFKIECDFYSAERGKGTLTYGINDPRLMNKNLNLFNMENQVDSSGIIVEIMGEGKLNVYRKGYIPEDSEMPMAEFDSIPLKNGMNHLEIASNSGVTTFFINGNKVGEIVLNPHGRGGDYIAYPVLGDLHVTKDYPDFAFRNIDIKHFREPSNIINSFKGPFTEDSKLKMPVRSMPELKTEINIKRDLKKAKMISSARGIYDVYVNGERIHDDYFNPGSTQYNKTHLYQEFDLTPYLKEGDNELLIKMGEGWWSGGATFQTENWNYFGDRQSFIANILTEYSDGNKEKIGTQPESWQYSIDGPLIQGSFFQGEIYDATREDGKERVWKPAGEVVLVNSVNESVGGWNNINFRHSFGDFVSATDTLTAISISEPRPGVYVYDMGANVAGVPLIEFKSLMPGQEVTLRYAEVLYPDMPQYKENVGMLMTENLREAMCQDGYISSGGEGEVFSPRFTLHGYRFLELTGVDEPLPLNNVKTLALSSVHDVKAHYECSDSLVNKLWDNIVRSTKSNFISLPTDCPQRNERLGWMGDISVFSPTATKLADLRPLLRQFLTSVRDCQSENGRYPDVAPTGVGFGGLLWGSAGITVPYEYYRQYGDTAIIHENYDSMKRYLDYVLSDYINPRTNILQQHHEWGDLADWLSPEYDKTDKSLIWECYLIYCLDIMKEMAIAIEKQEDAKLFDKLKEERKQFFIDTYIDQETGKTRWSSFHPILEGQIIDTQISYVLPIAFNIYNDPKFIENFINTLERDNVADDGTLCPPFSLMTGFIGTAWISEALSKSGNPNYAYRLLTSKNYPSWLYPVTQGATSIWERLNSYTDTAGFGENNSMNSFNHYSFGSVGNWLLTRSLGINILENDEIIISPEPDFSGNITFAEGWREIDKGRINSKWEIQGEGLIIETFLPAGTSGRLIAGGKSQDLKPGVKERHLFKIKSFN